MSEDQRLLRRLHRGDLDLTIQFIAGDMRGKLLACGLPVKCVRP